MTAPFGFLIGVVVAGVVGSFVTWLAIIWTFINEVRKGRIW